MTGTGLEEPAEAAPAAQERPRNRRRKGRGKKVAAAIAVLLAGGAVTIATLGLGPGQADDDAADSSLPPETAEVTRQTLVDRETTTGELGYGPTTTASGKLAGTLTEVPESGDKVARGEALFKVDDKPVVLMYGGMPAYRDLKDGVSGPDVKQLEKNLDKLGYSGFTVDEYFDSATAAAVTQWQTDLGLEATGTVEHGRVVFASGAVRIDAVELAEGGEVGPGTKVLSFSGTEKVVTVDLEVADGRLADKDAVVGVELPDGTAIEGAIEDIYTLIQPAADANSEATTVIEVVVGLADKEAAEEFAAATVNVTFTVGEREDVLTVPVAALLALPEGGFGVEVVEGKASRKFEVETGLFAEGRVEVSGDGIAEGTIVGIPA